MTTQELLRILKSRGCRFDRSGKGSHAVWICGSCKTTIPMHKGEIPAGTLRAIGRALEPCLGKGWWK